MTESRSVLDAHAAIGESPTWCAEQSALYWIDVKAAGAVPLRPGRSARPELAGPLRHRRLRARRGRRRGGGRAAHRPVPSRLASGAQTLLAPPPFDPALHRFNEGACDRCRAVLDRRDVRPVGARRRSPAARCTQLHPTGRCARSRTRPNCTTAWRGARTAAASSCRTARPGSSGASRPTRTGRSATAGPLPRSPKSDGIPDGAACDTDGGYWCAVHGGGRLRRYTRDGAVDRDIPLPVSQPTMCAFAGEELDVLYVTSASHGLSAEQHRREPLAGALLRLRPGRRGVPRCCIVK